MTSILDAGHPAVALMLTMDDLSGGVLVDQSGNLEDGTIHGVTAVAGIRNGAAYYNGSSYISFQDDTKSKLAFIHQTAVFHIATWVNFSNVNNGALNPILSSSLGSTTKGFSFFADDRSTYSYNKVLRLIITKGEHGNPVVDYKAPNNTVPDDGSYHLFEAWGDGSNIVLAVDGVTVGSSGVSSGGSGEMDNNLFLGAVAADTPSTFFAGKQDFTTIYRRPLTASERLEILELPNPYEVSGFIDVDAVPFSTPVRIYSATTGELLKETVSNVSGEYKQVLGANDPVVVVPEQPTGYEPLIHGPITPAPRS